MKRFYEADKNIDTSFVELFSSFCEVDVHTYSNYTKSASDLYQFRNYELGFEVKVGFGTNFIHAIFNKQNIDSIVIIEDYLDKWCN